MVSRSCRRPTRGAVRRTMSHVFRTVGHRRRPILIAIRGRGIHRTYTPTTNHGKEPTMANQQGQRQDEREATTTAKFGDGGERGLATRQYQDPLSMLDSLFERMHPDFFGTTLLHGMLPPRSAGGDRGL